MGEIRRIHIIGGPGSGKSYAARKLSSILNIKWYDLDDLYWHKKDKAFTKKTSEKQRNAEASKIAKKDSWIVEGAYTRKWVSPFVSKSDLIIILNPGTFTRAFRIAKRSLKRQFQKGRKESLAMFIELIRYNHQYDKRNLVRGEKLIKHLKKYAKYFNKADKAIKYILELKKN